MEIIPPNYLIFIQPNFKKCGSGMGHKSQFEVRRTQGAGTIY